MDIAELEKRVRAMEDLEEIRKMHRDYMSSKALTLFSSASISILTPF